MDKKLTTQEYWETYYQHSHASRKHIMTVCSRYDSYWNDLITNNSKGKSIIEIGGYPGRYSAYLAHKYDLIPTCLDFNSDKIQIKKVFDTMEVSNYHLLEKDFTLHIPEKQYDYVFSLGFIEHFENYDKILDNHLLYLKPGGRLLVAIPNLKYFRKIYGYLVDYKNLKSHNLNCMSLKTFENFANRNNLRTIRSEYRGGFPFAVHQKQNIFQKLISKSARLVCKYGINSYLEKHPTKYLSAGLIFVYEKPM